MNSKSAGRLMSLDAFRGITIAGMIIVNKPGSWEHVYAPLEHAKWNGWTPTDLIFPFFVFIVGVAMTFSFAKRLEQGDKRELYLKVFRRFLLIFLIGLFLNAFPEFAISQLRVAGVLQRIAVVYLIGSIIVLNTSVAAQAVITGLLLLLYWGLMTLVPVPGYGPGVLTPEGNLAAYIDSYLLPGSMWQGTWDPEGILSTIPAVGTVLLGVLTGHFLRSGRDKVETAAWLLVAGWGLILLGVFWGIWFPINKNLWTSSYTVFMAGAALEFLGVCYWLIDVKGAQRWFNPAIALGMNPILIYALSGMLISLLYVIPGPSGESIMDWIYTHLFASWAAPINASLAFALCYMVLWTWIAEILYRKKIFVKI